jgi:hypothetical protein
MEQRMYSLAIAYEIAPLKCLTIIFSRCINTCIDMTNYIMSDYDLKSLILPCSKLLLINQIYNCD